MTRLFIASFLAFALIACSGSGTTQSDAKITADATVKSDSKVAQSDSGADSKVTPKADAAPTPSECADPKKLAADAMTKGKKVFNGVTETVSTDIDTILADPKKFEGKVVRIEGQIIEVCTAQGCFIKFRSKTGKELSLKVTDGAFDFRKAAAKGRYAVGQGVFANLGSHGSQVQIDTAGGGAMIGTIDCPYI